MKQPYTIKLEPETIKALKKRAKLLGHSPSAYIRHIVVTTVNQPKLETFNQIT